MQTKEHLTENPWIRELGNGLILRRAIPADAEPLAEFNADVHRNPGATEPDERVGI